MTLVQAQRRYITRVQSCNTGHVHRVQRAAVKELRLWAEAHGFDAKAVIADARDVLELERLSEEA